MDHNDIRHKLSDYIDGIVNDAEKAEIEEHLKTCTRCSDALSELKKTIEAVRQIEEEEPPAWMTSKIMARVRAEAERRKSVFRWLFYPLAVKVPLQTVAVLFLAVTAFYIYRSIQPEMRYAEAPATISEAKKEVTPAGATQGKTGGIEKYQQQPKQVPKGPGYKALDMKLEYEKSAAPVPKEQTTEPAPAAAASAPAKPAEQFLSFGETTMKSSRAARTPGGGGEKAKEAPLMTMRQEQADRSRGIVAKEEAKPGAPCLSYEPDVVSVRGVIRRKDFPGPPNYESIARGDRRETIWILTLDKVVCVTGKTGDALDEPEASVSEMQLVLDPAGYAKYRGLLQKPVTVRGTLFHAHTGHHRTRVLLTVSDITERH